MCLYCQKGGQSNAGFSINYFSGNTRWHQFWLDIVKKFLTYLQYLHFFIFLNWKKWLHKLLLKSEQEGNIFEKANDFQRTRRIWITSTIQNTEYYHTCWSSTCHSLSTARWPTCLTSATKSTACLAAAKDADSKR